LRGPARAGDDAQVEVDLLARVERDRERRLLQRLVVRVVRAGGLVEARVGGPRGGRVGADVDLAAAAGRRRQAVHEQLRARLVGDEDLQLPGRAAGVAGRGQLPAPAPARV